MKVNYKYSIAAVATAVVVFNFSSCKDKEEAGPSNTELITGMWDMVKMGGEVMTDDLEVEMEFEADGDFSYNISYTYYGYTQDYALNGEWSWGSNEQSVTISVDGEDPYSFDVKKLTATDLWLEDEDNETWELVKK